MATRRHGANAIKIGEIHLLLTISGGGVQVHLTREKGTGKPGRGAVPDDDLATSDPEIARLLCDYDRGALAEPRWADKTLCGREWYAMVGGEGGTINRYNDEVAFAPTCRRCLALMDRYFPPPALDERLDLIARLTADQVCAAGIAEVRGVPGDQQAALRKAIRALIRERTGYGSRTHFRGSTVYVECEQVYEQHADEHAHAAAQAMERFLDGEDSSYRMPEWVISWATWGSNDPG